MGQHRSETGTMLLSRPGKMRWSYTDPAGKVFVLDGHYAWSYAPGDAQAQRLSAKQIDDLRSPLQLLLGHTQLEHELKSIVVAPQVGDSVTITGAPASAQARFTRLILSVTRQGEIQCLEILEADGARTRFEFRGTQEDVRVNKGDFTFTPPAGVPVLDGLPPI